MVLAIILSYIFGFITATILISILKGNRQDEIEAKLQEMYLLGRSEGLEQRVASMTVENTKKSR